MVNHVVASGVSWFRLLYWLPVLVALLVVCVVDCLVLLGFYLDVIVFVLFGCLVDSLGFWCYKVVLLVGYLCVGCWLTFVWLCWYGFVFWWVCLVCLGLVSIVVFDLAVYLLFCLLVGLIGV